MPQDVQSAARLAMPAIRVPGTWADVFADEAKQALEAVLPTFMGPRRWFASKARTVVSLRAVETVPLGDAVLALVRVDYATGEPETYALPLAFAAGEQAAALRRERPAAVVAEITTPTGEGILYDAVVEPGFCQHLLDAIGRGAVFPGQSGAVHAWTTGAFSRLRGKPGEPLPPRVLGVEQSNTNVRFGDRLLIKLYRRLEEGTNPDLEIGAFLTDKVAFAHIPPVAGALEYRRHSADDAEPITLGILQGFVRNQGDAWYYTLDSLAAYFERAMAQGATAARDLIMPVDTALALAGRALPGQAQSLIGSYVESAQLLGQRTAELHLALAADTTLPAFAPEPFTLDYQDAMRRSMQTLTERILQLLRSRLHLLPQAARPAAEQVLTLQADILGRFDDLLRTKIAALRTRIHGDYHLGQVLYTGDDFMIIDFEGEPARPLSERRQKRSCLQDVAGMLRSFHYAAYAAYFRQVGQEDLTAEMQEELETWARYWHLWVSVAFLRSYLAVLGDATLLPASPEELKLLLDSLLLEKAVYELGYELNNRPDWVRLPLEGILQTLHAAS